MNLFHNHCLFWLYNVWMNEQNHITYTMWLGIKHVSMPVMQWEFVFLYAVIVSYKKKWTHWCTLPLVIAKSFATLLHAVHNATTKSSCLLFLSLPTFRSLWFCWNVHWVSYLWCVFGDFPDKCGNIFLDILVWVFETSEHSGEDLSLNHHLSQVNRVLGNLTQRWEHLALHTPIQCIQSAQVINYSRNSRKVLGLIKLYFLSLTQKFNWKELKIQ